MEPSASPMSSYITSYNTAKIISMVVQRPPPAARESGRHQSSVCLASALSISTV